MSSDEESGGLSERLRTVTPDVGMHRNMEMDAIGWGIFAGLVVVMLPLLPVLVVVWVLMKLFGRAGRRVTD